MNQIVVDFGSAVDALKKGQRVARAGWNGKGMWLRRIDLYTDKEFRVTEIGPCEGTFMPFIVIKTPDGKLSPWNASQADVMAEDYVIVE